MLRETLVGSRDVSELEPAHWGLRCSNYNLRSSTLGALDFRQTPLVNEVGSSVPEEGFFFPSQIFPYEMLKVTNRGRNKILRDVDRTRLEVNR